MTFPLDLWGSLGRLHYFMGCLPYPVFTVDRTGRIVEVNEALLRATGYARDELINHHFFQVLPYRGTIGQLYADLLAVEKAGSTMAELEHRTKEGHLCKSKAMIFVLQSEPLLYMVKLYPQPKNTDHCLLEKVINQLIAEANLGVIVLNAQGYIVEVSQMACKLLDLERTKVVNQHIDQVFAGIPEEHRLVKRELLEGVKIQNKAMYWSNSSQRYELLVDSEPVFDETGQVEGVYILFKDVTNLRSLDQKIERNDRLAMIGQIAAGTAHEIRNPLTSIKGFLQMLQQSFTESGMERERTYTEIMLTEINRINSLVSEFLLLSKPRDVQYQMVDLNVVFEEILPIVESQALLHGIDVNYASRGQLPMVVGDNEMLKQVFLNICKNGIEAMGNEGILSIHHHIDTERDMISIDIHDNGPGIPPYVIDKIFDPFFTTKEEGTGLGLSVCQKIIHDIGGQIRVSSKGYGTTFHILLPYL
ncbi:PAS domain-containing sensor histidine kinase [Brevibacillus marinus]|uniref:PAS domain-containing sensor histidine kinase n=1 Tax=Brevibacillus marinus TaxID=2496837 RepID=UPI000F827283|nr:ATP-binding protein [Brevibacillus marinus]